MKPSLRKIAVLGTFALLITVPLGVAVYSSTYPAIRAYYATTTFPLLIHRKSDLFDEAQIPVIKRNIQKHFSGYNIFIPFTDILHVKEKSRRTTWMAAILNQSCGRSQLYVFVPLRFKFPIIGDRILEWCWRPRVHFTD